MCKCNALMSWWGSCSCSQQHHHVNHMWVIIMIMNMSIIMCFFVPLSCQEKQTNRRHNRKRNMKIEMNRNKNKKWKRKQSFCSHLFLFLLCSCFVVDHVHVRVTCSVHVAVCALPCCFFVCLSCQFSLSVAVHHCCFCFNLCHVVRNQKSKGEREATGETNRSNKRKRNLKIEMNRNRKKQKQLLFFHSPCTKRKTQAFKNTQKSLHTPWTHWKHWEQVWVKMKHCMKMTLHTREWMQQKKEDREQHESSNTICFFLIVFMFCCWSCPCFCSCSCSCHWTEMETETETKTASVLPFVSFWFCPCFVVDHVHVHVHVTHSVPVVVCDAMSFSVHQLQCGQLAHWTHMMMSLMLKRRGFLGMFWSLVVRILRMLWSGSFSSWKCCASANRLPFSQFLEFEENLLWSCKMRSRASRIWFQSSENIDVAEVVESFVLDGSVHVENVPVTTVPVWSWTVDLPAAGILCDFCTGIFGWHARWVWSKCSRSSSFQCTFAAVWMQCFLHPTAQEALGSAHDVLNPLSCWFLHGCSCHHLCHCCLNCPVGSAVKFHCCWHHWHHWCHCCHTNLCHQSSVPWWVFESCVKLRFCHETMHCLHTVQRRRQCCFLFWMNCCCGTVAVVGCLFLVESAWKWQKNNFGGKCMKMTKEQHPGFQRGPPP